MISILSNFLLFLIAQPVDIARTACDEIRREGF